MFSLKILFENACHGAVAPKGVPKCQICCVLGLCFRAFPFFIPFLPSHSLSHTSSLSYFSPPLAFPKEVNKKLSCRGQNAQNQTHERNTVRRERYILFFSVLQSSLAGGIMFSTCPFVCQSVRSFVCYQLVNAILRKRMNRFQCKLT